MTLINTRVTGMEGVTGAITRKTRKAAILRPTTKMNPRDTILPMVDVVSSLDDASRLVSLEQCLALSNGVFLNQGYGSSCESDEEPFWSANALHQTHLFIFMVAVIHISYATASILICLWRMRRWKKYEDRPDHRLKELKNAKLIYGRNTFDYWFWSFWAQFSPAVDESLYLSMRCLFIERMEFPDDFNFLSFVVNTLVEEFANVVRIDWTMWVTAAIWILVPEFLLVTTAAAVLLVLILGTKLEVVGIKLTQLAYLAYGDRKSARTRRVMAPNTLIREYD